MRILLPTIALATCVLTVACGGGPAAPANTNTSGATIAGTAGIASGTSSMGDSSSSPAAGVTVTVSGTNLSAVSNASGYFQLTGVPSGNVRLQFRQSGIDASADVPNVTGQQLVTIEVQLNGSTAVITSDTRSEDKITMCHRTDGHGYHSITIDPSAESAHRGHGDAKVGERVPGTTLQTFDQNCQPTGPKVELEKRTNGDDADSAPGPSIEVGKTVTWTYEVRNAGTIPLTIVTIVDNKGVSVSCPTMSVPVGQSVTCTGSGVATLGQYQNEGTVTASSTLGNVTASDLSHYLGVTPDDEQGPKVELCHKTGNGSYHLISVSVSAEPAHRAHGDAKVGEAVPGQAGKTFGASCSVQ